MYYLYTLIININFKIKNMKKQNWCRLLFMVIVLIMTTVSCDENDPVTPNPTSSQVMDVDSNIYNTVTIGEQVWMVENLKVTKFRNGDPIPMLQFKEDWVNDRIGGYYFANNDGANFDIYGALYNCYVINDERNIAPDGWHVATIAEWQTLISYIGGIDNSYLLKSPSSTWYPASKSTNSYGFTALPGGCITETGEYEKPMFTGFWWCYDIGDVNGGTEFVLSTQESYFYGGVSKNWGLSVRCVKDR